MTARGQHESSDVDGEAIFLLTSTVPIRSLSASPSNPAPTTHPDLSSSQPNFVVHVELALGLAHVRKGRTTSVRRPLQTFYNRCSACSEGCAFYDIVHAIACCPEQLLLYSMAEELPPTRNPRRAPLGRRPDRPRTSTARPAHPQQGPTDGKHTRTGDACCAAPSPGRARTWCRR